MKNTLSVIGIVVALLAGTLALIAFSGQESISERVATIENFFVSPEEMDEEALGAVSSPDIPSPYFSFGGVRQWAARDNDLTQATTTVCAIQSPAATSTLDHADLSLVVSSTTASTVTFAKAATPYATSTFLGSAAVAANAQANIAVKATTTSNAIASNFVFGPSQWFVVGMQGGVGTFSPTGVCQVRWTAF